MSDLITFEMEEAAHILKMRISSKMLLGKNLQVPHRSRGGYFKTNRHQTAHPPTTRVFSISGTPDGPKQEADE
jgi:hypothetical protein